jgi:hypothetical protein
MSRAVYLLALCVVAVAAREVVNFDFAWRHQLHELPPPSPRGNNCSNGEEGVMYGGEASGVSHRHVPTGWDCCQFCAADPSCGCWDVDVEKEICYTKSSCNTKTKKAGHFSGILAGQTPVPAPTAAPTPGGPPPPAALPGFDDSAWALVDAPHDMLIHQDYNPQNSNGMAYIPRNKGWYRKHFKLPADWKGSSVWIYFEGVFHETTAYLNGKQISHHKQGYTGFAIRLDNVAGVKFGDQANVLALHVDASTGTGWWYQGGGLTRHNYMVRADPLHIEQDGAWVYTNSTSGGGAAFHTSVQVVNAGGSVSSTSIVATVRDASGAVVASGTSKETSDFSAPIVVTATAASGIHFWTVRDPALYTVTVELLGPGATNSADAIDSINITTGVRTIRFDADTGLYVNEQNIKMRGFW